MPISKHYGGHGAQVMASMMKSYKDPKKAKDVFYATENKMKSKLAGHMMKGRFKHA